MDSSLMVFLFLVIFSVCLYEFASTKKTVSKFRLLNVPSSTRDQLVCPMPLSDRRCTRTWCFIAKHELQLLHRSTHLRPLKFSKV